MKTAQESHEEHTNHTEKRRHHRYRYSVPFTIRRSDGTAIPAISLEMSEGGVSALIRDHLGIGELVEMEPIGGGKMSAIVRHTTGMVHGFEFINPTPEQVENILEKCRGRIKFHSQGTGV